MKKRTLALVAFCFLQAVVAADLHWLTSVPEAEARAQKEHKLVLLQFTGSDWCPACKVLEGEVLSKPEFADYANKNLVPVLLDFPAAKKQPDELRKANEALQDKYKVEGFPTLILLKPDGTSVWTQLGYSGGGVNAVLAQIDAVKNK